MSPNEKNSSDENSAQTEDLPLSSKVTPSLSLNPDHPKSASVNSNLSQIGLDCPIRTIL
jgi:hypothetical protein